MNATFLKDVCVCVLACVHKCVCCVKLFLPSSTYSRAMLHMRMNFCLAFTENCDVFRCFVMKYFLSAVIRRGKAQELDSSASDKAHRSSNPTTRQILPYFNQFQID